MSHVRPGMLLAALEMLRNPRANNNAPSGLVHPLNNRSVVYETSRKGGLGLSSPLINPWAVNVDGILVYIRRTGFHIMKPCPLFLFYCSSLRGIAADAALRLPRMKVKGVISISEQIEFLL